MYLHIQPIALYIQQPTSVTMCIYSNVGIWTLHLTQHRTTNKYNYLYECSAPSSLLL